MMGRRLPDTRFGDLPLPLDQVGDEDFIQPGDIWKYTHPDGTPISARGLFDEETTTADLDGNLEDTVWGYCCPNGLGIGTLMYHTVREHEDGTVSVIAGDGSSNSILHTGPFNEQWHGYIDHNEWNEV